jgi:hypothetical protein
MLGQNGNTCGGRRRAALSGFTGHPSATLAFASCLGGAIGVGLTLLLALGAGRPLAEFSKGVPAGPTVRMDQTADRQERAEEAMQRTFEGRAF